VSPAAGCPAAPLGARSAAPGGGKTVALTFDDGPGKSTSAILAGVWLWSVDTQDWMAEGSGSPYWVQRIIRLAEQEGGALRHPIVLMHDEQIGNPATVSALPAIIAFFRAHGYRFVAL
jgi:peptidoglycan/xylan/chitin deacetylase (PgdA/CDA1 family)